MQTEKTNIIDTLAIIEKKIAEVNHEIDRIINDEGLNSDQIEPWINHLNNIIRKADRAVEILLESKTK
jgi:hypothetical protein